MILIHQQSEMPVDLFLTTVCSASLACHTLAVQTQLEMTQMQLHIVNPKLERCHKNHTELLCRCPSHRHTVRGVARFVSLWVGLLTVLSTPVDGLILLTAHCHHSAHCAGYAHCARPCAQFAHCNHCLLLTVRAMLIVSVPHCAVRFGSRSIILPDVELSPPAPAGSTRDAMRLDPVDSNGANLCPLRVSLSILHYSPASVH